MGTKVGRSSAKKIIKDVMKFCKGNQITGSELWHATGYSNAHRLLAGELVTVTHENEELLRLWLEEAQAKPKPVKEIQLDLNFDAGQIPPLKLMVPVGQTNDLELDLMQALAFVVDNYRTKLTPKQLGRAVGWVQERC